MMRMNISDYLVESTWSRADIEYFLDPTRPSWARFDGLTGYVPADIIIRDGMDGCSTVNSYDDLGPEATLDPAHLPVARRLTNYRGLPCRVNTYGDSFTQCHQVSDGETWQEILAAHLGEPIRNFGVGGYGVYQAFCRMRAIEPASQGADYVVLNIFDDDHVRNLDAARWFRLPEFRAALGAGLAPMLHANPWAHLRMDPATGGFVEKSNILPTAESLFAMSNPDFVVGTFGDDPVVALDCLRRGISVGDVAPLESLAEAIGVPTDLRTGDVATAAADLLLAHGLQATLATLQMVRGFLREHGKRLMVMLSYGSRSVVAALEGRPRFDQVLLDDLSAHADPVVDGLEAHVRDFPAYSLSASEYCDRYYNGHYTPRGNHFFAFAAKDAIVNWLDPPPRTYADPGAHFDDSAATLA
jgi:hypothetical protein